MIERQLSGTHHIVTSGCPLLLAVHPSIGIYPRREVLETQIKNKLCLEVETDNHDTIHCYRWQTTSLP